MFAPAATAQDDGATTFSGRIGPMSGEDHAVELQLTTETASITYPELGCSGQLVPTYRSSGTLLEQLQNAGAVEFNEVVSGSECPTGGFLAIADDGAAGWIVERQGGSTGARRWSGAVSRATGPVPEADVAIAALPAGTVAGVAELGLFLGEGPLLAGIGSTSTVAGVEKDSLASVFGLVTGDVILSVDNGAGDPAAHSQMIQRAVSGAQWVVLRVQGTDGEQRIVTIYAPQDDLVRDQLVAASRSDALGPALDPVSFRLRLIMDGAFEALSFLGAQDMAAASRPWSGDFSLILEPGGRSADTAYLGLIAAYAVARLSFLGRCSDAVTPMRLDVVKVWETRRGGVVTGIEDRSYSFDFETLSKFAPIVEQMGMREQPGAPGWTIVLRQFGPAFEMLSCEAKDRENLEANMLAYYQGGPPIHTRD